MTISTFLLEITVHITRSCRRRKPRESLTSRMHITSGALQFWCLPSKYSAPPKELCLVLLQPSNWHLLTRIMDSSAGLNSQTDSLSSVTDHMRPEGIHSSTVPYRPIHPTIAYSQHFFKLHDREGRGTAQSLSRIISHAAPYKLQHNTITNRLFQVVTNLPVSAYQDVSHCCGGRTTTSTTSRTGTVSWMLREDWSVHVVKYWSCSPNSHTRSMPN